MRSPLFSSRRIFPFFLGVSACVLITVYASQWIGGLVPCELCLWQRVPYVVAVVVSLVGLFLNQRYAKPLLMLLTLIFLISFGLAFFHAGVEWKLWKGLDSCAGTLELGLTKEQLLESLMATPMARCDEPAWTLFGVSMAGYNAILSLILARFSVTSWPRN